MFEGLRVCNEYVTPNAGFRRRVLRVQILCLGCTQTSHIPLLMAFAPRTGLIKGNVSGYVGGLARVWRCGLGVFMPGM